MNSSHFPQNLKMISEEWLPQQGKRYEHRQDIKKNQVLIYLLAIIQSLV